MKQVFAAPALAGILSMVACAQPPANDAARNPNAIRLAVATFSHETGTFCPIGPNAKPLR